jgi:putative ubiquitin-RnfH superfamily antitoxin RatB of RatAB toxin-antitoxin module
MPESRRKRCLVACDGADGVHCVEVDLDAAATIAEALTAARAVLTGVEADWDRGNTGVWGEIRPRGYCPADGDRVELYRRLPQDPRARRRERLAQPGRRGR